MAKVQSGDQGIKLFGTTITLHGIRERKEEEKGGDCELDGTETETGTEEKKRNRIIACPRCKSMETKFCYFNNYNVNQPRHFCKGCQRYWTAGGALRNVPVGAGRRKAKPPCTADGTGFYHEASTVQQFGLDEEWHVAATMVHRDFHQLFPYSKRRRMSSGGQPC